MEHADVTFLVDNDAVFNICKTKLDVDNASYRELNQLIAQVNKFQISEILFKVLCTSRLFLLSLHHLDLREN